MRRRSVLPRTNPQGSILPPSDRRRRLGRRLRSFVPDVRRRRAAVQAAVSESRPWNSPGTDGPASACAARTRSSSTDPYQSVVGPTGRGITGDIVTFSHPDDAPLPRAKGRLSRDGTTLLPTSLDEAFVLDGPGEYEVKDVLITGVRTYRDDATRRRRPASRSRSSSSSTASTRSTSATSATC